MGVGVGVVEEGRGVVLRVEGGVVVVVEEEEKVVVVVEVEVGVVGRVTAPEETEVEDSDELLLLLPDEPTAW